MGGTEQPKVELQPHLGKMQDVYKPEAKMGGYLSLAKVITVHHKRNTADVQIIKSNYTLGSNTQNEGKFAAKILVSTAHFSQLTNTSSGVVEPIQEGQLVILAFLDSLKNEPIIIGSCHNTFLPENNILTSRYPLTPDGTTYDRREANKYLRVYPAQGYYRVDGVGGIEYSLPSKTFLKIDNEYYTTMSDDHMSTDHKDLEEKDPYHNMETRSAKKVEDMTPVRMLFVHRSNFQDDSTTWTKVFVDVDGTFRTTRDNNDGKLLYTELTSQGAFRIRKQIDSPYHGKGEQATEVSISEDGELYLKHACGSYIKLDNNGDIIINAVRNIHLNQGGE